MRYVKGHRLQTRSRIVEHASYGLRQRGADGLSVVDLMKLVGLTHGGFYSHFEGVLEGGRGVVPAHARIAPGGACCGRSHHIAR